jgi:phospholipid/cholesterol/gamma-HCH transport system permease protein
MSSIPEQNPDADPLAGSDHEKLFPFTRRALAAMRRELLVLLDTLGCAVLNAGEMLRFIWKGQFNTKHLMQQMAFVGIDTLGIALVMTIFSGMVIALQIAKEMVKQGAGDYVGALVSMAIIREMAPIMTGFAVIAMAGSAYAAELSTMQITSQVSALEVLHVSPVRYLLMPRVLAGMIALPLMNIITAVAGILGGLVISYYLADIHPGQYLDSVWNQTGYKDVFAMLGKSCVFGFIIFTISATIGLNTTGGSREVGKATTRSVVWSFILMAISDYILTYLIYGTRS